MLIPSFITMLCVGGVAFYLRFLVALCKEWKLRRLRIRKESRLLKRMPKVERRPSNPHLFAAALQIAEIS
jgi:hypothetical protein